MDWKARIDIVQEVNQGDMQVGATLADADVPAADRVEYPWTNTYSKEWLEERVNGQVAAAVVVDLTAAAQSLASAGARIDVFKAYIGTLIDLDVVL